MLLRQGFDVTAFHVDFGQASRLPESAATRKIGEHYGIRVERLTVAGSRRPFSYGEVVGRNSALVFMALMFAPSQPSMIAIGVHSGTPYFDCSAAWAERTDSLIRESTKGQTGLLTPLLQWSKGEIARYAVENGVPIGATYSCEIGSEPPCGGCLSCQDRKKISRWLKNES